MTTTWRNLRTGKVHNSLRAAMNEAKALYGWPSSAVLLNEIYVCEMKNNA